MAHNKLYRNFIILQEDERGHSESSDKALSGYAKVEAKGDKCKISFYAQNLKKDSNYFMVLICCKRDFKELIDLGPLTINEAGKGDTSKEYYINNIADLKVSYEKISGAAICKTIGKETDFIMHGFMNGEEPAENWRKFKMVKVQSKRESQAIELKKSLTKDKEFVIKKEVSKTEVSNIKDINLSNKKENILPQASEKLDSNVSDIEEKIVEDILSADERSKYKNDKKDCDKKADKVKCQEEEKKYEKKDKDIDFEQAMNKLYNELEYCSKLIDLDVHDMNSEYTVYGFIKKKRDNKYEWTKFKMEKCPKSTDLKGYVNKRIEENTKLDLDIPDFDKYEQEVDRIKEINDKNSDNGINEYFEGIAKDFELYNEKLNDIENCKWYKININSIEDLCNESDYNKYTLAYYPMINYYPYINKNNYFLLGYKSNSEGQLEYIVYAIPGSKEKNEQPYGGKTGFVTWTSNNTRSQGYWLMFYDFINSSIVVPMRKI